MLSVACKPFLLSVIMLSVVIQNVVAPFGPFQPFQPSLINEEKASIQHNGFHGKKQ